MEPRGAATVRDWFEWSYARSSPNIFPATRVWHDDTAPHVANCAQGPPIFTGGQAGQDPPTHHTLVVTGNRADGSRSCLHLFVPAKNHALNGCGGCKLGTRSVVYEMYTLPNTGTVRFDPWSTTQKTMRYKWPSRVSLGEIPRSES